MSKETYVGKGLWKQEAPDWNSYQQSLNKKEDYERQLKIQRDLGILPRVPLPDVRTPGVFVQIVAGRPVVSIQCSDDIDKLDELTALAKRIMDAVR